MALQPSGETPLGVWNPPPEHPPAAKSSAGSNYRHREATQFRGVTKTSGTNTGLQKFDVQFVFCDHGTKKHPKIYGFCSAEAAATAFDVLTCKRAIEKGRSVAAVLQSDMNLGTNHPAANYRNEELLGFLASLTRDDVIYGLKVCAKKGYRLESMMLQELTEGVVSAQRDAAERSKLGDGRQSYEATAKGPLGDRKKRGAGGVRGVAPTPVPGGGPGLGALGLGPSDVAAGAALGMLPLGALGLGAAGSGATPGVDAVTAAFQAVQTNTLHQAAMLMQLQLLHQGQSELAEQGSLAPGPAAAEAGQHDGVPPGGEAVAAVAAAAATASTLSFLQEVLRLASGVSMEMLPALDVLRLWASLQPGGRPPPDSHLPHWYYQSLLPSLHTCPDLGSVLLLCAHLWQSGTFRALAASASGPELVPAAGDRPADCADRDGADPGPASAAEATAPSGARSAGDAPAAGTPPVTSQAGDRADDHAAAAAAAAANNNGVLHMLLQMSGMGVPAFVPGLSEIPGLSLAGLESGQMPAEGAPLVGVLAAQTPGGDGGVIAGIVEPSGGPVDPDTHVNGTQLGHLMSLLHDDGGNNGGLAPSDAAGSAPPKRARIDAAA